MSKDLSINDINIVDNMYGGKTFNGIVSNPSKKDIKTVWMTVLLYKDNQIVYGCNGAIDSVLAKSDTPFSVDVYRAVDFDRYKIYPIALT